MLGFSLLLLLSLVGLGTATAGEPLTLNVKPLKCAMQGVELSGAQWDRETLPNGLEDFMFDLNGDGLADVELLVPIGDLNRIPLFYWFNGDDGEALYTLSDSQRAGTCAGMRLTWQKYQPNWKGGA